MATISLGVDIAKDTLVCHCLPGGEANTFPNTAKGHRAFIAWQRKLGAERTVFEPTGPYHKAFERSLAKAGIPYAKVNPLQVRRFAEAIGTRAKTDPVDAGVLAQYGAALNPAATTPNSETIEILQELLSARRAAVKRQVAAKNQAAQWQSRLLRDQADQTLRQLARQIAAIETEMRRLVAADPALQHRLKLLQSVKGIGETTAMVLLVEMPELGTMTPKEAASLAGLAPMARQSGRRQGRAHIGGGRKVVRDALYMPVLVAVRFNPSLKAQYDALVAAGKPAKLAITAAMRKLITYANAVLRENRPWANNPA